jgi:hypothetical protein
VANQLVVTEAPRAPDLARHDRLVANGLALLERGPAAAGQRAAARRRRGACWCSSASGDPAFRVAAEAWLGDDLEAVAIEHCSAAELWRPRPAGAGGLLLERGERELRDNDRLGRAPRLAGRHRRAGAAARGGGRAHRPALQGLRARPLSSTA